MKDFVDLPRSNMDILPRRFAGRNVSILVTGIAYNNKKTHLPCVRLLNSWFQVNITGSIIFKHESRVLLGDQPILPSNSTSKTTQSKEQS